MNAYKIIAENMQSDAEAVSIAMMSMAAAIHALADENRASEHGYEGQDYKEHTKARLARLLRDTHILAHRLGIRGEVVNRADEMAEKTARKILKKQEDEK